MHSNDTVDRNGDGYINETVWDYGASLDNRTTVDDLVNYLQDNIDKEGAVYDINGNGIIEPDLGEGDRNGDGVVDVNDCLYTEKYSYYWFVKNSDGTFSAVLGDRYGYQLKYNSSTGLNERVQIDNIALMQDLEQTEAYKNAGFNILFLDSSLGHSVAIEHAGYSNTSMSDFTGSLYETVMDYAEEVGLKVILFGGTLHSLSNSSSSLIVSSGADGKTTFASQAALNAYVAKYMKNFAAHPAFYGVSLVDEPSYAMFDAIGEVCQAIKAYGETIGKDIFVMENLLPFARDGRTAYDGVDRSKLTYAEMSDPQIYISYLNAYYEKVGKYIDYVQYDDYPLMIYQSRSTLANYIQTHQITSEFAAEKGIWRSMVVQTYGDTKLDGTAYGRRAVSELDVMWQTNVSLAMGVKQISYYTLRPVHNTAAGVYDNGSQYPIDRLGNQTALFGAVKRANAQMNFMSAALNNFTYKGLSYYGGSEKFDVSINKVTYSYNYEQLLSNSGVTKDTLTKVSSVTLGGKLATGQGLVLVTEHYDDETGLYGYYVVNASDTFGSTPTGTVTLTFNDYDAVQVWKEKSVGNEYLPANKTITLSLGAAEGVFIVPFNL